MKGDPRVITALNARLVEEWTGINQYAANVAMLKNWQFQTLVDYVAERLADEVKHAQMVNDQILFLNGIPVSGLMNKVTPGKSVEEMLAFDHLTELNAIRNYNATLTLCAELGDELTGNMVRLILADEGDHINDIEARQMQIAQIGIGPFLAVQIGD